MGRCIIGNWSMSRCVLDNRCYRCLMRGITISIWRVWSSYMMRCIITGRCNIRYCRDCGYIFNTDNFHIILIFSNLKCGFSYSNYCRCNNFSYCSRCRCSNRCFG